MTQNIRDIIMQIELFNTYEDVYSVNTLIDVLKYCDKEYYNQDSLLSDTLYDDIKLYVGNIDPTNTYFKSVGSEVRGGKVKLPHTMGSLNQVYIGEIQDWIKKNKLEDEQIIITDKLDGTSALVLYDESLKIGYSRGDGIEGADITRHLKKMETVPKTLDTLKISVRGENIISHNNFPKIQAATSTRSKAYSNARNAVAGIMNAKENPDIVYKFVHFVAYDIVDDISIDKSTMLTNLVCAGFDIPWYCTMLGKHLTDELLTLILNERRVSSPYQIDGLVLDVNSAAKRAEMNKNNNDLNPLSSIKYKVADAENIAEATVVNVEWNASKHAYLKPRIEIEPIQLCGVTVTWTQGFNAAFIKEHNIGPGTRFMITRTGDVIPHIVGGTAAPKIIQSTYAQMPDEEYIWNDTGVDIMLASSEGRADVIINQLIDFFTKLKVPGLKEGNISFLVDDGYTTPEAIIKMSLSDMIISLNSEIIGEKVFTGITKSLVNVPFEVLMGAYSTSRGIGIRKVNAAYKELGLSLLKITDSNQLLNVTGFDTKTAVKLFTEIQLFNAFILDIKDYFNFAETPVPTDKNTGLFANQYIVMTGFRDTSIEQHIESNGGTVQTGVSKKTTLVIAANPADNSGKTKKANDLNIKVMSRRDFVIQYPNF